MAVDLVNVNLSSRVRGGVWRGLCLQRMRAPMSEQESDENRRKCVKCGQPFKNGIPLVVDGGYVGLVCGQTQPTNIADLLVQALHQPKRGVCTTCAREAIAMIQSSIDDIENEEGSHAE